MRRKVAKNVQVQRGGVENMTVNAHTVCYADPRFLMLFIYLCSGETAHFLHHLTIHVDLHKYCKTITGQFSGFISEKKMSHMFLETCVRVQILGGKQVKKSPAFTTKRSKM